MNNEKTDRRKNNGGHSTKGYAGRKPQNPEAGKKVKCSITLTKEHFEQTANNRSRAIELALEAWLNQ